MKYTAFLFLATSGVFLISWQPPQSLAQTKGGPPNEIPAANQKRPDTTQRGTEEAPFIIKIEPPAQSQQEAPHNQTQTPQKTDESWITTDRIAIVAAIAGVIQALALLITIIVLVTTARRQLRAYVLPDSGTLGEGMMLNPPQPAHAGEPGVVVAFRNSGPTPAYRYVNWAQIAITEPVNAHTLVAPKFPPLYPASIGAGSSASKALWYGRALTQSEIADIVIGRKLIFVYGRLEYRDTFRRKRWANFRLQYQGPFPPAPGIFLNFSESGNDSN